MFAQKRSDKSIEVTMVCKTVTKLAIIFFDKIKSCIQWGEVLFELKLIYLFQKVIFEIFSVLFYYLIKDQIL